MHLKNYKKRGHWNTDPHKSFGSENGALKVENFYTEGSSSSRFREDKIAHISKYGYFIEVKGRYKCILEYQDI